MGSKIRQDSPHKYMMSEKRGVSSLFEFAEACWQLLLLAILTQVFSHCQLWALCSLNFMVSSAKNHTLFWYFTQKSESIIIHPWMQKMDKYSSTLTWEWIINHTIYPLFWIFLLIVKENIYFQRNDITTSKSSKERTSGLIKYTWLKYTLIV